MAAREPGEEEKGLWGRWRPWLIVSLTVLVTLALLTLALVVLPPLLIPGGRLGPPVPQPVPSVSPSPSLPQPSPAATPASYIHALVAGFRRRPRAVPSIGVFKDLTGLRLAGPQMASSSYYLRKNS